MIAIPLRRLDPGLPVPAYARPGDAGLDLYAAHDVTLAPGDVANALLSYTQAGFYTPSKCAQVSTAIIQVYPPNQTTPVYVAYSSQICSNKKIHELRIGTVHAGSGGG